jgi:hypothetical protein
VSLFGRIHRTGWTAIIATAVMVLEVVFIPYLDRNRGDWIGGPFLLMLGIALSFIQLFLLPFFLAAKRRIQLATIASLFTPVIYSLMVIGRYC